MASARAKRVIKRYSNRKLYDTRDSRYVTLAQVAQLLRAGEEVSVVDNSTKEDLTEVTLAQIIYEEQKTKGTSVPLQALRELIHSRTEKVLSELREGPIGRLIPGGSSPPPPKTDDESSAHTRIPTPAAPDTQKEVLKGERSRLVDQAKERIEDWQHKIDDRIRALLPNFIPGNEIREEMRGLSERISALEERLRDRGI